MYTREKKETDMKIARACGWTNVSIDGYGLGDFPYGNIPKIEGKAWTSTRQMIPRYSEDLNAMHEAITQYGDGPRWMEFRSEFTRNLLEVVRRGPNYLDGTASWYFATATPMRLAEAFLRTLNLWKA